MQKDFSKPGVLTRVVKVGDRVVTGVALILFLLLLLYGSYTIWYTWSVEQGSFVSDEMLEYKPVGRNYSLDEMRDINPDVVAWLTIDDTHIDYPVVQGKTDSEYLNKNAFGEFSLAGSIFLTCTNSPDFSDAYNVMYGHDVERGAMFSDVLKFQEAKYFNAHVSGSLRITGHTWGIELFACVEAPGDDPDIYADPHLLAREELPAFVDRLLERADQTRAVSITPNDTIVALSTCKESRSNQRVLLFGKLVPYTQERMDAEQEEAERRGIRSGRDGEAGSPSFIDKNPWLLPGAGALLLILLLIVLFRILRRPRR